MKGVLMEEPIIQELEDGRIIKQENDSFSELVNGEWVEPVSNFSIYDFLNGKTPSSL